jgi:RNA polymerase sigma factor (sigma-70 family)
VELILEMTADELVERCRKGDAVGYRLLYTQYANAMYNTALRIVNHTAEAEDILQESFIDAFHSLNQFGNRSTFGAWLKKIVINKSINRVKRGKKNWVDVDLAHIDDYVFQDDPEVDEQAFAFRVESIRQGMKQLPDGYRTVLSLYLVESYKHEEIAGMLGISPATVRTQYKRAKKKLLEIISKNATT